jgi:hypothetical protein
VTSIRTKQESLATSTPRPSVDIATSGLVRWRAEIVLVAVLLTGLTALLPLYDPDLPMHLATGEWIVQHRTLPIVEPFAWTRAGDPFYAYSWLPETVFYLVHRSTGPLGLRLLQGLLMLLVGLSTLALSRTAQWSTGTQICLTGFSVLVAGLVTPSLRPQIVLLIVLPLVWAELFRLRNGGPLVPSAVRLLLLSALAVNSHLFFVLVLAPVPLLLIDSPVQWRRVGTVAAVLVGGWLLTPYVLEWPALIRANFTANAMLASPSPIAELQPGFAAVPRLEVLALPALLLTLLPWALADSVPGRRARALIILYWLVGLLGFAYASRLLLAWWLLVLPFAGLAVERRAGGEVDRLPRLRFRLPAYAVLLALLVLSAVRSARSWKMEGTTASRTLSTVTARGAEPLAAWLSENLRPGASGRLFTVFNYGSYLTWRLPGISPSIDGRTIFPDSVARAEALVVADRHELPLGPWRSADLAIVPLSRRAAASLDSAASVTSSLTSTASATDGDWKRVAVVIDSTGGAADSTGLWVRRSWWREAGRGELPATLLRMQVRQ